MSKLSSYHLLSDSWCQNILPGTLHVFQSLETALQARYVLPPFQMWGSWGWWDSVTGQFAWLGRDEAVTQIQVPPSQSQCAFSVRHCPEACLFPRYYCALPSLEGITVHNRTSVGKTNSSVGSGKGAVEKRTICGRTRPRGGIKGRCSEHLHVEGKGVECEASVGRDVSVRWGWHCCQCIHFLTGRFPRTEISEEIPELPKGYCMKMGSFCIDL